MIDAIQRFLVKIKEQEHIVPLISQADFQVNLQCEEQTIQLGIKSGDFFIVEKPDGQQPQPKISGSENAMIQLLEGTERLRSLEQQRKLIVSAPLRTALLLESVFFLTKARERHLV